jgi:hypothetical protein
MVKQPRLSVLSIYYQYDPIARPDTSRLLVLEPGRAQDPLVGSLTTLDLRKPVSYEAVSYTWGKDGVVDQITLDGKRLDLTPNLGAALRRLRRADASRVIWVDQISINQKDTVERGSQVGLMNSIYRRATRVLVWLGEDPSRQGEKALRFMRSLDAIFKDSLLYDLFKKQGDHLDWFPNEYWESLSKLMSNSWVRKQQTPISPVDLFVRLFGRRAHKKFAVLAGLDTPGDRHRGARRGALG